MRLLLPLASLLTLAAAAPASAGIISASVTPAVVHGGSTVSANVRTTPDVRRVVVTVTRFGSADVPRVGPGRFSGSAPIPFVQAWARGVYHVTFTAYGAHGASTASTSVTAR